MMHRNVHGWDSECRCVYRYTVTHYICVHTCIYSVTARCRLLHFYRGQNADLHGLRPAQGQQRMEQRRFSAAVSILDDAYRLLSGIADREQAEHTKAATAATQSRVGTATVLYLGVCLPC